MAFGSPDVAFATVDHDLHHVRRAALNPFFSKKNVIDLEPVIKSKIEVLCQRFERLAQTGESFILVNAFACLTTDVITEYAWGQSYDYLTRADWAPEWYGLFVKGGEAAHLMRMFPWIPRIMRSLSKSIAMIMNPAVKSLTEKNKDVYNQLQDLARGKKQVMSDHRTVFRELLESDLPPEIKNTDRLGQEAVSVVSAGVHTSATTLKTITYYILQDPAKIQRLREELLTAMPLVDTQVTWSQLEHLPYLHAFVQEGLRLAIGISARLPRICPDGSIIYHESTIPSGVSVSLDAVHMHLDPRIFPNPRSFNPDRWIEAEERGERLGKYFAPFSKGSRQCVGINLPHCQIFLTVATIFRRFNIELIGFTHDNVEIRYDHFLAGMGKNSGDGSAVIKSVIRD